MKKIFSFISERHESIFKIALFVFTITFIVFLFPKEGKFKFEYQKGLPWSHADLIAPFPFAINKASDEIIVEQSNIRLSATDHFRRDASAYNKALEKFKDELSRKIYGNNGGNENNAPKRRQVDKFNADYLVGADLLRKLYETGIVQVSGKTENMHPATPIIILTNSLAEDVLFGDLYTVTQAQEFIVDSLNRLSNSRVLKTRVSQCLESSIVQNVKYDEEITIKILEKAIDKVSLSRGMVKKGELIISKGEVVDEEKFLVLESIRTEIEDELGSAESYRYILLGQIILVSLAMSILGLYLVIYRKDITRDTSKVVFLLLLIVLIVLATAMLSKLELVFDSISIYVVPFCLVPIITRAFFDSVLAFF